MIMFPFTCTRLETGIQSQHGLSLLAWQHRCNLYACHVENTKLCNIPVLGINIFRHMELNTVGQHTHAHTHTHTR